MDSSANFFLILLMGGFFLYAINCGTSGADAGLPKDETELIAPSVLMVILVRNKEHTLPYFLAGIERLRYPKQRISLWIRSDHNIDNSAALMERWVSKVKAHYHSIDIEVQDEPRDYVGEKSVGDWTKERYDHIMNLRQEALNTARRMWADYVFYTDADNIIYNRNTLTRLMEQNKTVVAPKFNCTDAQFYSNFWGGMDKDGYYKRTEEYIEIVSGHKLGLYRVPMVHSTFLINLRRKQSQKLAFKPHPNYVGPYDDLVIWANSAIYSGVPLYILNTEMFGYLCSAAKADANIHVDREWFRYMKQEAAIELEIDSLPVSQFIKPEKKKKSKLGFDEIYVINLARRVERKRRMVAALDDVGVDAKFVDAVDGKQLNETYLENLGVRMMPDYIDRYHKRPLTFGEIGCFLSHYKLWEEMANKNYKKIMVLEDDSRFVSFFRYQLDLTVRELDRLVPDWDLMYLGRKIMFSNSEQFVANAEYLVYPYYTYWTVGYILSLSGARKLLMQQPLGKMVPVDEYLPIMFDHHPIESWKSYYAPRDLVALSAEPRLVHPTHYTGHESYVTDTENTTIYTKYAITKPLETIYDTIAEGENAYVEKIRQKTAELLKKKEEEERKAEAEFLSNAAKKEALRKKNPSDQQHCTAEKCEDADRHDTSSGSSVFAENFASSTQDGV